MKRNLMFLIIVAGFLSVCVAPAKAEGEGGKSHLDQYPGVGGLFRWGMSVAEIEKVSDEPVTSIGPDKYQASFLAGQLKMNAVCVVTDRGLEALALQFDITPEEYSRLVERLKDLYGDPRAVDSEMGAVQWRDGFNDTGVVVVGEQNGHYSVLAGLRWLRESVIIKDLAPGKISSLEGVTLGMTQEQFLAQYKHFRAEKLPREGDMLATTEIFKSSLTVNLHPAEAFFEFNQDRLDNIVIYVSVKPEEQDSGNVFLNHLGFLSDLYGSPVEEAPDRVTWNDGKTELRFGAHPLGEFVISWELLP